MNTIRNALGFAANTLILLSLVIATGCSNGDGSTSAGSVLVAHTFEGVDPQDNNQDLYSLISGQDSYGNVIYGPLTLPYAEDHILDDVPTAVVLLRIEYRLGTGQQVALATTPVVVRSSQLTQVVAAAAGPPGSVQVELVNDSDNTGGDEDLFVLFDTPKGTGSATKIDILTNSGSATASATGVALSTLGTIPKSEQLTLTSPYTGKERPIYSFTLNEVDSGRLTFSYSTAAAIVNGNAPTAAEHYRYDKLEITYLNGGVSGGNLTAIDFFSIPLQVEVIHWGEDTPDPMQTKTFYASTPTILKKLKAFAPDRMGPAFKNLSDDEFQFPVRDFDLSDFARVLSPNTIAAAIKSGSPAPYPSFGNYLKSLQGKTYVLNGTQFGGYKYQATFEVAKDGGYVVHCSGTTTVAPASPLPANAAVTLLLPEDKRDFFIYAAVANKSSYTVEGFPFVDTKGSTAEDKVKLANASPYGAIVGDIQAALNFGYPGGRFDSSTTHPKILQDLDTYYSSVMLPYAYPYGGARVKNDGFYNPYAGLFYYLSDAYGHPYSDRLAAASPLYSLQAGDTVRITILNDYRLDTPVVRVAAAEKNTLKLAWPKIPGATGYNVELSPNPSTALKPFASQDNPTQTHTITGLKPGVSYLVSVTATGSKDGKAIASAALPIQGVTKADPAGSFDNDETSPDKPSFKVGLSLTPNFKDMSFSVNGKPVNYGEDVNLQGVIGTNTLNLSILDAGKNIVYQGTYFVKLEDATPGHFKVVAPYKLEYNTQPLTQAGPPSTPPYPLGDQFPLTIGTPFGPKPYYQYFDTRFP